MKEGDRVRWKATGEPGTVKEITRRDDGGITCYVEFDTEHFSHGVLGTPDGFEPV